MTKIRGICSQIKHFEAEKGARTVIGGGWMSEMWWGVWTSPVWVENGVEVGVDGLQLPKMASCETVTSETTCKVTKPHFFYLSRIPIAFHRSRGLATLDTREVLEYCSSWFRLGQRVRGETFESLHQFYTLRFPLTPQTICLFENEYKK